MLNINNQNFKILQLLESIEKRLCVIEIQITSINNDMHNVKDSTNNMDSHISFVENIYDSVKYPFYFIMNSFSKNKIEPPNNEKLIKEN